MDIINVDIQDLLGFKKIAPNSHKGQNGKLFIIGGSKLFHSASIWSLTVASRIVDLVHYASTPENNDLVSELKSKFLDGIVVPREEIENYLEEDNAVLIGPGMVRSTQPLNREKIKQFSLAKLNLVEDEGELTQLLVNYLLSTYPKKQWVIDAGALQMLDLARIPQNSILTPHAHEFEGLWLKMQNSEFRIQVNEAMSISEKLFIFAEKFQCIVLLKGQGDLLASGNKLILKQIVGGNPGMTKGGTGDVLAGLIAALACTNDPYLAAMVGSYVNKSAGDRLYKRVGPFFNATDLALEIPVVLKELFYA